MKKPIILLLLSIAALFYIVGYWFGHRNLHPSALRAEYERGVNNALMGYMLFDLELSMKGELMRNGDRANVVRKRYGIALEPMPPQRTVASELEAGK